jgi:hypothetical protein
LIEFFNDSSSSNILEIFFSILISNKYQGQKKRLNLFSLLSVNQSFWGRCINF